MSALGFWVRKGHVPLYRSLNTNSEYNEDQFNLWIYLGVSDLSSISVASIFVLLSETDQQTYLHASMCHNVQKRRKNAIINEKPCFD